MTPPAEVEAGSSPPPLATEGSAEPAPVPTVTPRPTEVPGAAAGPEATATPAPVPTVTPRPTEVPGAAAGPEATATPELLSTCSTLLSTLDAKAYDEVALAIERSGVLEASNAVALTLFAPADDGFAALPMGVRAALERDTRVTADLVRYHVTEAALPAEALRSGTLETLQPDPLVVRTDLGGLTVNHAGVVEADVQGGDCVVHGIDAVLVPPRLMRAVGILSLDAAVGSAPVDFDALDELTPTGRRTAEAVCAYVTGVERFLGIPALRRTAGDSEASDRRREEAVTAALTDCGADRVVVEAVTPPSVDG